MADQKISELTALTGANVADDDAIAIVDTSATETKKIVFSELKNALDTATGFVRITGDTMTGNLSMGDNVKAIFGAGSDLQIYHDGTHSRIDDTGTGKLILRGNDAVEIHKYTGEYMITAAADGAVTLYHDDSSKLATTSTGVDITGNLTAGYLAIGTTSDAYTQILINSSTSGESELRMGDTDTDAGSISYTNSNDTMTFRAAAGARMALDSTGLDISGTLTSDGLTVDGAASIQPSSASIPSGGNTSADDLIVQSSGHTGMTIGSGTSSTGSIYFADSGSNSIGRIQYNHTDNSLYLQTNAEKRLNIASTGDISFYEDTGTTAKFFWDASAESLGIGTSSPTADGLQIVEATQPDFFMGNTADPDGFRITYNSTDTSIGTHSNTPLRIRTNGSEAMRIDSSGNLLVGKTSSSTTTTGFEAQGNGQTIIGRTNGTALKVNRLSSDGDIAQFRKDGSTVGSIGSVSGATAYIDGGSGFSGIQFGGDGLVPRDNGALADNTSDLGTSSYRFKDLYLSGGVYLGGTGSANKLDDYEEGTWTPSVGGATTNPTVTYGTQAGFYVKIGRMVHISMYLNCTAISGGAGAAKINGIPFSANNAGSYFAGSQMEIFGLNVPSNKNNAFLRVNGNSSHFRLEFVNTLASSTGGTGEGVATADLANNFRVLGSLTYMTS